MMWGYGPGYGWMAGAGWWMLIFLFAIVTTIVFVTVLVREKRYGDTPQRPAGLDILDQRYAKGEIQREEYLQRRHDLQAEP
jgi:putative membrane protein